MDKGNLVTGSVYFLIEKLAKKRLNQIRQVGLLKKTSKNLNCIAAGWLVSDVDVELEKNETEEENNRRSRCKVAIICRHLCLTGCARSASASRLSIHLRTALFLISQAREVFLTSSWVNRRTNFRETDKKQHVSACRTRFFSSKINIPIRTKNGSGTYIRRAFLSSTNIFLLFI